MSRDMPHSSEAATIYELHYSLDRADLVALTRHHLAHSRLYAIVWIAVTVGFALALGLLGPLVLFLIDRFLGGDWVQPAYRPFVFGVVVAHVLMFALMFANRKKSLDWLARQLASQNQKGLQVLGESSLKVSREGITAIGAKGETIRPWQAVSSVMKTDGQAFLCADVVFVIPRRAFADEDRFEEFLKSAHKWLGEAK